MKLGLRKPSLKKSFSARTSGVLTRSIKRALIPGYGRRGSGWFTNPKRALYNRVYRSLTIGVSDVLKGSSRMRQSSLRSSPTITNPQSMSKRLDGLKQSEVTLQFINQYILNNSLNTSILNAANKILGRINSYMDKSITYQDDLYQYITKDIGTLQETAKRESTKYECSIALDIIEQLYRGVEASQILDSIQLKYPLWQAPVKENKSGDDRNCQISTHIPIPKELQNNLNAKVEAKRQKEIIYELSESVVGSIHNLKFINAWIKILSYTEKHSVQQMNLFDYLLYVLAERINQVKRETTKHEYSEACEIVQILQCNQDSRVENIVEILKCRYK